MQDRVPRMQHQTLRIKNLESFQILTNGCTGNSGVGPPMARRKKLDDNDASTTPQLHQQNYGVEKLLLFS